MIGCVRGTLLAVLLLAGSAILTGCGDETGARVPAEATGSTGPATGAERLTGRLFRSVAVTENGAPRPLVAGSRIELRMGADGSIVFSAGCNDKESRVTITDDRLVVDEISTSDMACTEPRMAQDDWLSAFFRAGPTWRWSGRELVLTRDRTEIRLAEPVAPTAVPRPGGRWTVYATLSGGTETGTAPGVEAFLTFDGRDRVTGSTGCNQFGGQAITGAGTIEFRRIVTTEKACTGGADTVERAVLDVLNAGRVTFAIEENVLRLTVGDRGLLLRAT
jgi:heat shock protein HslJ